MRLTRILFLLLCSLLLTSRTTMAAEKDVYDVVVYGGSASGIIAAVSAARSGAAKVVLVSANPHLGGMVTNGLFRTDVGRPTVIGGIPYEFWQRGDAFYQQHHLNHASMWNTEPHIAEQIFNDMLKEANVVVAAGCRLKEHGGVKKEGKQIVAIRRTCSRRIPWRSTYAFWAPMAMISEAPSARPERPAENRFMKLSV